MHRHAIAFVLIILAIAWPGSGAAQPMREDPPLVGRPPQFSGIVGQYTLEAIAAPTTVHVEEPIVLRIRIIGRGPDKYQPQRRQLQVFPAEWEQEFYVEPVADEDRAEPRKGTWEFVYRLRPKSERVQAIGGLKLVYYDSGRKYQTAYQESDIPLVVKPRPEARADWNVPSVAVPPSFYALASADEVLAPPTAIPSAGWLALIVLAPPALCLLGWRVLRAVFPRAVETGGGRDSPAAQHALYQLQNGAVEPAWGVMTEYLRERLGYPACEPAPAEVAQFLRRRGVSRPLYQKVRGFFEACDAARFAPVPGVEAERLRGEAAHLIDALEGEPCLA